MFQKFAIPIISSSFELLFDRYCKIPNLSKSVDAVLIRHNDNTGSASISTKDESRPSSSINDESGESLVDTTLSILKMLLLSFISFLFVRKGKIPSDVGKFQGIKGFNWILRLRAGYKYNTIIAIRSGRVSDDCPKFCPCCGKALDELQFDTWGTETFNSSLELLFERFSKNTFITKSADVVPKWQRNSAVRSPVNSHQYTFTNSTVPNTEPIVRESLVDTTLSILKIAGSNLSDNSFKFTSKRCGKEEILIQIQMIIFIHMEVRGHFILKTHNSGPSGMYHHLISRGIGNDGKKIQTLRNGCLFWDLIEFGMVEHLTYILHKNISTSISTTTGYLTRKLPTDTIIVQNTSIQIISLKNMNNEVLKTLESITKNSSLSNVTIFFLPILLEFTFVTMFFKNSEMNFDIAYLNNSHEKSVPLLQDYDIEIDSILMFPY
ncbi:hypothetical protein H8356DRAFT_1434561 [Neocallimastix lanati (nom. inval.)]|nr:hypothetical protein H8356DRAFT_1434561 [Neocallimastix sp. JGI-2020a]